MGQTLTRLLVHVVFSTKERRNLLAPAIESDLHAYMGGICRNLESPALAFVGTENHVHLLISLSKNIALSELDDDAQEGILEVDKDEGNCV